MVEIRANEAEDEFAAEAQPGCILICILQLAPAARMVHYTRPIICAAHQAVGFSSLCLELQRESGTCCCVMNLTASLDLLEASDDKSMVASRRSARLCSRQSVGSS